MSPLRTKQSIPCLLQDKIDCRILNWHSQNGDSMNLQEEAKTWVTHNLCDGQDRSKAMNDTFHLPAAEIYEVVRDLTQHLGEVICNTLEDLSYQVRRASGPDHACSIVEELINEIKANASAESEDKPIEQDPKVGNDDL